MVLFCYEQCWNEFKIIRESNTYPVHVHCMYLLELKVEQFSNDNDSVRLLTVLSIGLVAPTEAAVGILW